MTSYKETMRLEAEAILAASERLEDYYPKAFNLLTTRKPVLFSGMGKSGFVAQKAASTFRSLGIPAHYVHPADASHGDLGAFCAGAVAVLLSHSGDTPELGDTILFCEAEGIPIIAVTGNGDSALAKAATAPICYGPVVEACPNGLAPTTSTTVAMSICDALAVDASRGRALTPMDFRRYHPGGSLGNRLRVARDVMRSPVPTVKTTTTIGEAALAMTGPVSGIALVLDRGRVTGVLTDGDLRRAGMGRPALLAGAYANRLPIRIEETARVPDIVDLMNKARVTKVLVEDMLGAVLGVVNLHDIT